MKKILPIVLMLSIGVLLINMLGFKNFIKGPEEIEETFFVLTVGIDKGIEKKGNVRVSILEEKFTKSESVTSESPPKEATVNVGEGRTVFEAVRNLGLTTSKKVFFGQIKQLVISEEVAKENITDFIDFMVKDNETRFNIEVLIAKGDSAESILKSGKKSKEFVPDTIQGLIKASGKQSFSKSIKLIDLMVKIEDKYSELYVPTIEMINTKDKEGEEKIILELNGFAIFDRNKMIGTVSGNTARGLNWIDDKVVSGVIVVKDSSNADIALEIVGAKSEIKVELKDNSIIGTVDIDVTSNIGEQMSQVNMSTEEGMKSLEDEQSEQVKQEVESIIDYAQKNKVDIFGIGNKAYHKYPLKWENMKEEWKETFKNMKIKVNVKSTIVKSYHVEGSLESEKGGNK